MPEAIATTKRKFYKALDALTTTSQSAAQQVNIGLGATNKRPVSAATAFDEARERVRKRLRQSTSTASLSSLPQTASVPSLARPSTASTVRHVTGVASDATAKPPPNFSPWSHETFLARLKTYSNVGRWHPKPEEIGEVQWAKRGWICVDTNTVACRGGCERRVIVILDSPTKTAAVQTGVDEEEAEEDDEDGTAFEKALVERYKAEIINGHAGNCLWYKAGCKDDIYRLQVVRPSVWQPELRERFQSLLNIGNSIIEVDIKGDQGLDKNTVLVSKLLSDLPSNSIGPFDASSPEPETALTVALHGWYGSSESGNRLLQCGACFQRIGLWMYQPGYRPRTRGRDAGQDTDDTLDEDLGPIDLVEMHREHCPWRNAENQRAIGSLSGLNACQILQRVATTCAKDHRRRSAEQVSVQATEVSDLPDAADELDAVEVPRLSRAEIVAQDQERESRLRKLKNLFNIKRRSTVRPAKPVTTTTTTTTTR